MGEPRVSERARQVDGVLPKMILAFMRRALGQEAVDRVLEMAGQRRLAAQLEQPGAWSAASETLALAEAAAELSGDPEIGRRMGEELIRSAYEHGHVEFILATGSVAAALELTINGGTKMSSGRQMELVEVVGNVATLAGRCHRAEDANRVWCGISAGYYAAVPTMFGARAVITEPECQARGDERCIYRLVWEWPAQDEGATSLQSEEIDASRERSSMFVERFAQLHRMATDLAGAEQVDTLLERIADSAGLAIEAPKFLFAINGQNGPEPQLHYRGFTPAAAARFGDLLLRDEVIDNGRAVVADIVSGDTAYGRLGAIYPRGYRVTDWERQLVEGYARHVGASLATATSLEMARRDRDTAQALLELAKALAEVGRRDDVVRRVAEAVPTVAGCQQAAVWLWDPAEHALTMQAHVGAPAPQTSVRLLADEVPELAELVRHPAPFIVSLNGAIPAIGQMMETTGLSRCAVVPVQARGAFLGVIVAGFDAEADAAHRTEMASLMDRLGGLADLAATALDNADLLDRVESQALHDALTGLPNRTLIADRADQALVKLERTGGAAGVLFVDLDRFKNVNDTLGHEIGDELIRQAAERIGGAIRKSDTLGRLGGDEFVVLLSDMKRLADAVRVADKIIESLREPFELGGREVFISCSVGIATAPAHGVDYSLLLRRADAAMYEAKESGRGSYAVWRDDSSADRAGRLELEGQLHAAIGRGELCVVYQPQIDLRSGRIVGVEALVRWAHPVHGLLGPDRFLPLAEESGLIGDIDQWVRAEAFRQARAWCDLGLDLRVAINLSTRELSSPSLAREVAHLLAQHHLDPGLIELEITDRVVMDNERLPAVLAPLRALGVRLAIDDFGTGTSVLGRLQSCPVDTLKIDRSFVELIAEREEKAPVLTALIAMAQGLGLEVVAEGVETARQEEFLRQHGCGLVQGFFFSRPVPADDIPGLVARMESSPL